MNALSPQHALAGPIPVFSFFSADSDLPSPGLTISNNTHSLLPAAHVCARGFASLLHSPRIEGWAERRETFGCSAEHPWGVPSARHKTRVNALATRHARRLARRLASHDAGRSPLGAPRWRFWAPGAALPSPWAPAVLQRRAGALRIRAASSSHPGRSAWRAGSLPPGANGYEPPPQDATPRSAFRIVSGDAPHERGWERSSTTPIRSQQKYTTCSQKRKAALSPCRPQLNGYSSPPALSETMKHYGRTPIRRALDRNQARRCRILSQMLHQSA